MPCRNIWRESFAARKRKDNLTQPSTDYNWKQEKHTVPEILLFICVQCNDKAADKHTPGLDKLNAGMDHMKCKSIQYLVAQNVDRRSLRPFQYRLWLILALNSD